MNFTRSRFAARPPEFAAGNAKFARIEDASSMQRRRRVAKR